VDIARHARHIALPEIGPEGQARISRARVAVVGADLAAETAALYLKAAGVQDLVPVPARRGDNSSLPAGQGDNSSLAVRRGDDSSLFPLPAERGEGTGEGSAADRWRTLLSNVDLVVRSGFDDDTMAGVAARLGLPVIIVRAQRDVVDMVAFARRPPAPDAMAAAPYAAATPPDDGPAAVLAGTLAAAEALHVLARGNEAAAAPIRHLRLPLDGREPLVQEIGRRT
jgi:adenylyltransferase/sulfurtransferase